MPGLHECRLCHYRFETYDALETAPVTHIRW